MMSGSLFEVRSAAAAGYGVFALQDLPASTPVIEDSSPFVAVLDSPMLTTACSWCFVYAEEAAEDERVKLSACTGCKIARYCGKTCQASAWKHSHKYECKIYAQISDGRGNVLPNTARMVLQILLRRQHGVIPAEDWAKFLKLRHHLDDFKEQAAKGDETYQNLQLMVRGAVEYSSSREELGPVETLVGRLLINTLTLMSPLFTPLGLLLSLPVASVNHSCFPNAIPTLSRRSLTLRTLEAVSSGSELTVSYNDITVPPAERRATLQTRYHFHCNCRACSQSLTLGLPEPPPALSTISASTLNSTVEEANSLIVTAAQTPDPYARLDALRRALALFVPAFPAFRPPLARVRSDLIHAFLATRQWVPALAQSLIQRVEADPVMFAQENHPARVARAWVLARLLAQAGGVANDEADDGDEALAARSLADEFGLSYPLALFVLVRDVAERAQVSHGEGSQLAREAQRELARLRQEIVAMGGKEPEGQVVEEAWDKFNKVAKEGWNWWLSRARGKA